MPEDQLRPTDSASAAPFPAGSARRPADVPVPARMAHLPVDPRGYPIIASVPQDPGDVDFGALSEHRKLVLATYDLCAVCALPFRGELRWQVTFDDQLDHLGVRPRLNEAPVHEVCALYAAQVCPFVSSPTARLGDPMRKGQRRADTLVLAGFERTSAVTGHRSELQVGTGILMFEMDGLARTYRLTGAADARAAYAAALRAEPVIDLDDAERRLIELLDRPTEHDEDAGSVMAGAAWVIGAAFCPQINLVRSVSRLFKGKTYDQMAATFIAKPEMIGGLGASNDASFAAASAWFTSRDEIPALLQQWRADGTRRIRRVGSPAPSGYAPAAGAPDDETLRRRREAADKSRRRSTEKARRKQRRNGR